MATLPGWPAATLFDRDSTVMSDSTIPPVDNANAALAGDARAPATSAAAGNARQSVDDEYDDGSEGPFSRILSGSASWMMSLVVHMALIIVLALWYLPTPKVFDSLLAGANSEPVTEDLVELPDVDFDDVQVEIDPEQLDIQPETDVLEEEISFSPFQDEMAAATAVELSDFGLSTAPEALTTNINAFDGSALAGRGHASRAALVRGKGGTAESEAAVAEALSWLATHQNRDGSWSLDHTGGACQGRCSHPGEVRNSLKSGTALALLPFLGAGQTRFEGKYKNEVGRAIDVLVRMGERPRRGAGASWADAGNMYAHGIAAIAMCEAYGMTGESQLMLPAQAALDYIVSAQNPNDGGWRYNFQQPGDTSVVGWQVMALKSGHLAKLNVPYSTVQGASHFLDLAQSDDYGSGYAYVTDMKEGYRKSTSAVGLLCRMYLGWKKDVPALTEGVQRIAAIGPSQSDFYYNYYAAQLLFQYTNGTGPMWQEWNTKLRDYLVASQEKEGHAKGSWYVPNGHQTEKGGRLYCTAMACMTLEVYYRHMPIYQSDAVDVEFPE